MDKLSHFGYRIGVVVHRPYNVYRLVRFGIVEEESLGRRLVESASCCSVDDHIF